MVEQQLKEFGLRENEITLYLSLLRTGPATPMSLAQHVGMSRPYVYDALERLLEKGVVSTVHAETKLHYLAATPERLAELAQHRAESMHSIVGQLQALQGQSKDALSVEIHKGKYVYRTLLLDILATLKKNDEVLIYGIDDDQLLADSVVATRLNIYFAKIKRLHITERAIVKHGNTAPLTAASTQYRYLAATTIGQVAYEVYGNTLALLMLGSPNHLILIKDKHIANSYRNQFEMLWKAAAFK